MEVTGPRHAPISEYGQHWCSRLKYNPCAVRQGPKGNQPRWRQTTGAEIPKILPRKGFLLGNGWGSRSPQRAYVLVPKMAASKKNRSKFFGASGRARQEQPQVPLPKRGLRAVPRIDFCISSKFCLGLDKYSCFVFLAIWSRMAAMEG